MNTEEKLSLLKQKIESLGSVLVAFSGGVDSAFLLAVTRDVLHDQVLAATAVGPVYPQRDTRDCIRMAGEFGVEHRLIRVDLADVPHFADNRSDRCYRCKYHLFSKLMNTAESTGLSYVIEGSNVDDLADNRPGMKAVRELGIRSPLLESGLGKEDIRELSRRMGLESWNKPPAACLASRIGHGEKITEEKLAMVEAAEDYLLGLGLRQVRVRMHGDLARIEVGDDERRQFGSEAVMDQVSQCLGKLGFGYITLDLQGYRTGSMSTGQVRID